MPSEFSASRLDPHLALVPHVRARHQTIAKTALLCGSLIISIPCYASVLLPADKGRRCDACHVLSTSNSLRRCSGCASYWYCDNTCQNLDWQRQHKRICKHYNRYIASGLFQALAPHEKLDALLLSHLAARISLDEKAFEDESPLNTFMSLLPGPAIQDLSLPVCGQKALTPERLYALYSRFGNNNFVLHSHLTTFGHGIFPLASRLFNHSCMPNAAAKYQLQQSQLVQMEVVALREILPNEEICLPYLDPALLQERSKIFELTYGFTCDCSSCAFLANVSPIPAVPEDFESQETLARLLHEYVAKMVRSPLFSNADVAMPVELLPVLSESYLSKLTEQFSTASHDGPFDVALDIGKVVLDLYNLIYPPNYPQIGMHLLEMAKTAWNNVVSTGSSDEQEVRHLLQSADKILSILGPEGDDGGPLQEMETLKSLLSTY